MTSTNTDNPFFLGSDLDSVENPSEETMIKVDHVSMIFNMASETLNNLKEYSHRPQHARSFGLKNFVP